jgi:hypothetical protein
VRARSSEILVGSKAASLFVLKETRIISQEHTYEAGCKDSAVGVAIKRPLCNTGTIFTIKEVSNAQVALTGQARSALHMASCSYVS